jgi:hypothetical protein
MNIGVPSGKEIIMSKPLIHAKISVKKYGGIVEDYIPIHNFIDSSKSALPDMRHRAILHSSFGIYITEQVFGVYITNSEGKDVSVRDIAEDHVMQDLGFIPTPERWFQNFKMEDWMMRKKTRTTVYDMKVD